LRATELGHSAAGGFWGVDFVDTTVVRLADPTTRSALFDEVACEQILSASYTVDDLGLEGPFEPLFDEVDLGFVLAERTVVEGGWNEPSDPARRQEALLRVTGLPGGGALYAEALWRGAIAARSRLASGRIVRVGLEWASLAGVDQNIIAARGSLPSDPIELEAARREQVVLRLRGAAADPSVVTAGLLDRLLLRQGATTVGGLLGRAMSTRTGMLQIEFAPDQEGNPLPRRFPITAALLIRGAELSVAQLLRESKLVQQRLEEAGLAAPREPGLLDKRRTMVVWVVPDAVFDDAGGPGDGATDDERRRARRLAAGTWLAREGIGLVAVAAT
jgi:hypothetical protein